MNCETNKTINYIYKPILQYGKKETECYSKWV